MSSTTASLGNCPECGAEIAAASKLIEYERTDGTTGVYAECDQCRTVVTPK
ncbi:hypothetical protein [Halorussus sp. AFM4]|uniref:DUF7837 family putative zinc-binding protein n=1 Tax=Halorussus sp. AFM4 TaxID=3421651 RepID=UPI003EBB51D7